jgi:aryl-alcohol dehydrogenase-like predicted oxidoreductase
VAAGRLAEPLLHSGRLRETLARVEQLRPLVPPGSALPDLALRFILHHPAVSTTIPGCGEPRT